jgi:hypothetical protein
MHPRRFLGPLAAFLVLVAPGLGAEPKAALTGPKVWFKDWPITLRFSGTVSDDPPTIVLSAGPEQPGDMHFQTFLDRNKRPVWAQTVPGKTGVYRFALIARGKVEGDEAPRESVATLDVQVIEFGTVPGPTPTPTPIPPLPPTPEPIPPTPIPTPTPTPTPTPEPVPPLSDEPIAQKKTYRVLILHQDLQMSRGQERVFNSPLLADRLNDSTMPDPDGRASWRKFDIDTPLLGDEAQLWAPLLEQAKTALSKPGAHKLPVIIFFQFRPDGSKRAHVYPLPETEAGMIDILRKFGS